MFRLLELLGDLVHVFDPSHEWGVGQAREVTQPEDRGREEDEAPTATEWSPEWIDLRDEAAKSTYRHNGKIKISRYRRRKPGSMRTIVVHQTGVERRVESKRYHHISAHYAIRRDGAILRLFDHDVRLVSANSLDRGPHHAIGIEVCGNFEGVDGSGRWYNPAKFGEGRATDRQLDALCVLLDHIAATEPAVDLVAPHRVSGRDKRGKPNRQICPGSRVWKVAERWALVSGRRVPGEGETFGGAPIPPEWRSEEYTRRQGAGGEA